MRADEQIQIPEDDLKVAERSLAPDHTVGPCILRSLHRIEALLALLVAPSVAEPAAEEATARCSATTASGAQCKRAPKPGGTLCGLHAKTAPEKPTTSKEG